MPAVLDLPAPATPLLLALRDLVSELPTTVPDIDTHELEIFTAGKHVAILAERARGLLHELETVTNLTAAEPDLAAVDPDAWSPGATKAPSVADVCFAGLYELRRADRQLASARTLVEQVIAIEIVLRKLRRAIRAVLEAARDVGGVDVLGGIHQGLHRVADVESGLAVRRLYADFRAALRAPTAETPEAILEAMRYAAGALATMLASPAYPDVRAADRSLFRVLRERVLRWAREDRAPRSGRAILSDVVSSGELLRAINQRPELRAHDQAIVRSFASLDLDTWLLRLDALRGLDDTVDRLVAQSAVTLERAARGILAVDLVERLRLVTGVTP